MQKPPDLNGLRLVAAVSQAGSLAGAARRLGVDHATVFRGLGRLERQLGVRLFERARGRYVTTPAGAELARAAAETERIATESLLKVAGKDRRPDGPVRLTTTDSIAGGLIAPLARTCRDRHPGIRLEVVAANEYYNLSQRDADIALRTTREPPQHLIGKKVGVIAMAVYGAPDYLKRHRTRDLAAHAWAAPDESMAHTAALAWLARFKPLDTLAYRTNTFTGIGQACLAGIGLAVLPCFFGDRQPALRRVTGVIAECTTDLWLLTHPDLRDTVRVKTVFQALQRELVRLAPLLTGRRPRP